MFSVQKEYQKYSDQNPVLCYLTHLRLCDCEGKELETTYRQLRQGRRASLQARQSHEHEGKQHTGRDSGMSKRLFFPPLALQAPRMFFCDSVTNTSRPFLMETVCTLGESVSGQILCLPWRWGSCV